MIFISKKYLEWGGNIIGKELVDVEGVIYFYKSPELDHPQLLKLIFSGTEEDVIFRCGKDGSTLELSDSLMEERDFGELGKELVMNLSSTTDFSQYIGMLAREAFVIYSRVEEALVGVKVVFNDMKCLFVINLGDEINIFDSIPSGYEEEGGFHYISLKEK